MPKVQLTVKTRSQTKSVEESDSSDKGREVSASGDYQCTNYQSEEADQELFEEIEPRSDKEESLDTSLAPRRGEHETQEMAEARGPSIIPPRFRDGTEGNVEEYLAQFERVARANGWDNSKKLVILPCYLEGAALKWYENLEAKLEDAMTWQQVRDGMKDAFQAIAWEEQLEYRLRMRMQNEEEPVESYVQDITNLCAKVDPNMAEKSKIKYVLRGLKPSLLEKVMMLENDTLDNLMKNVRRVQTARFMAGQRVDHLMAEPSRGLPGGTPAPHANPNSNLEARIENLATEFSKMNMRLLEQRSSIHGRGQQRGDQRGGRPDFRGRGRGGQHQQSRGRTADGRVICYKCSRPGHYAVSCRSSIQNQGNGNEGR